MKKYKYKFRFFLNFRFYLFNSPSGLLGSFISIKFKTKGRACQQCVAISGINVHLNVALYNMSETFSNKSLKTEYMSSPLLRHTVLVNCFVLYCRYNSVLRQHKYYNTPQELNVIKLMLLKSLRTDNVSRPLKEIINSSSHIFNRSLIHVLLFHIFVHWNAYKHIRIFL